LLAMGVALGGEAVGFAASGGLTAPQAATDSATIANTRSQLVVFINSGRVRPDVGHARNDGLAFRAGLQVVDVGLPV
jgi:hypothetical protein